MHSLEKPEDNIQSADTILGRMGHRIIVFVLVNPDTVCSHGKSGFKGNTQGLLIHKLYIFQ